MSSSYPPAPWDMHGQAWLSLFHVRAHEVPAQEPTDAEPAAGQPEHNLSGSAERHAGLHAVGLVSYESPSPLTYAELLVARPHGGAVTISDIWVDSPASRDGGRELWAIPKELGDFHLDTSTRGPLTRAEWSVSVGATPVVRARFRDPAGAVPRLPLRGSTRQYRADATEVVAGLIGSAQMAPARSEWHFEPDGPLGWLAGKRPLATFRMRGFRMLFG